MLKTYPNIDSQTNRILGDIRTPMWEISNRQSNTQKCTKNETLSMTGLECL